MKKNNRFLPILILVLGLLLLGLFARIYQFGLTPQSMYWDEVAIGLDARSLLQTGKDLNGNGWLQPLFYSYGDYKAPVYIWLTTLIGKLLGQVDELTVRLPSLLAFSGTALVFYLMLKRLHPKKSSLPLLAVTSLTIMPWSIHFSRIGMESHLSLFWLTLMTYWAVLAVTQKPYWWLIPAASTLVLGTYSYINIRVIGPLLLTAVFWFWRKPMINQWRRMLPFVASAVILVTLGFGWLTNSSAYRVSQNYRLSNDNLLTTKAHIDQSVTAMAGDYSLISRIIHHRYWYWLTNYVDNYSQHLNLKFLFLSGDANLRHHSGFGGQMLLVQLPLFILGLFYLAKTDKKSRGLMLAWLIIAPLVAALVNEVPHASRAIYLMLPLAWLTGLGWSRLPSRWSIIFGALLLINLGGYTHDYFGHYPLRSNFAWIKPYKDLSLQFADQPASKPIYISPSLYKPELYLAFYLNDLELLQDNDRFYYYLPEVCPQGAICVDQF